MSDGSGPPVEPSSAPAADDAAPQVPHAGDESSEGGSTGAYQAAQAASPWGYVFLLGVAGLLASVAWYKVEEETGLVTQVSIFVAALLMLAPVAWHAVDFFRSVASRRGGAFAAVVVTVSLGVVIMSIASALNVKFRERLPSSDLTESGRYTLGDETRKILARIEKDGGRVFATYLERSGPASRTSDALRQMAFEQLKVYGFESPAIVVRRFDELREKDATETYLRSVGVMSTSSGESDDLIVLSYAEAGREVRQGRQKEVKVEEFAFAKSGSVDGRPRWLGERVITSAIQELVFVKLKAYATGGHGERGLGTDMREIRERLRAQNVDVAERPLDLVTNPTIPADCDLLLVLGPEQRFEPQEEAAVRDWLAKGRALFLALDVDETGTRRETGLEQLLDSYGVAPRRNYVVFAPKLLDVGGGQGVAVQMTPELHVGTTDYADHASVEALRRGASFRTVFLNSSFLEVDDEAKDGLTVEPVIWAPDPGVKDVRPWAAQVSRDRRDYRNPDPSRDKTGVRLPIVVVARREIAGDAETGPRDARVVVSGDADAFSDAIVTVNAPNADLFGGLAQWALRRADLAAVSDKTLDLEMVSIGDRERRMAFWWPLVVALQALLAGSAVWWARRR